MSRPGSGQLVTTASRPLFAIGPRQLFAGPRQLVTVAFVAAIIATGCNKPPAVHPWREDSIPSTEYRTASSDVVLAANVPPAIRQRDIQPMNAPRVSGDVPHYPLWWEDPFEDQGDGDRNFAWTWRDYFHMPYGLARFITNTIGTPASMVVTPPCMPMVSDGELSNNILGKVHDATRGESPNPTAGLEDFNLDESTPATNMN